jgi:hypothetical protein
MISISGKCRGVMTKTVGKDDKKFTMTLLGISDVVGDWATEQVLEILIPEKSIDDALIAKFQKLKGQNLSVSVDQSVRVYKASGSISNIYLSHIEAS